ncbi:MAG: phage head closure protein [Aliifodinibius sp.]|nr:phage head closure protein [Fodinibius sp.]NIV11892.1 phage head closure protein [Fodinibius sp.]NIY25537.1 phage head closure protein [Fodinibius sp.]
MNSGKLDRLINIREQVVSTSRSTDGAPIITTSTISSNVWAKKEPLTGREYFTQDQRYYDSDIRYRLRHTTAITETCKIHDVYSSVDYDVKMFQDIDDRHRELIVLGKRIK